MLPELAFPPLLLAQPTAATGGFACERQQSQARAQQPEGRRFGYCGGALQQVELDHVEPIRVTDRSKRGNCLTGLPPNDILYRTQPPQKAGGSLASPPAR